MHPRSRRTSTSSTTRARPWDQTPERSSGKTYIAKGIISAEQLGIPCEQAPGDRESVGRAHSSWTQYMCPSIVKIKT